MFKVRVAEVVYKLKVIAYKAIIRSAPLLFLFHYSFQKKVFSYFKMHTAKLQFISRLHQVKRARLHFKQLTLKEFKFFRISLQVVSCGTNLLSLKFQ